MTEERRGFLRDRKPDRDVTIDTTITWPHVDHQLLILFMSRCGSSLLCRHIEATRPVSRVGEAFNRTTLDAWAKRLGTTTLGETLAATMRQSIEADWYVAKAGFPGLSIAERLGYLDHSIERTRFWLLFRRDVAAQAVSATVARLSGRYHSTQAAGREIDLDGDYDEKRIVRRAHRITAGYGDLAGYARATGRPMRVLCYEDYADGDFTSVDRLLDETGVPRRPASKPSTRPPLERIVSAAGSRWKERVRCSAAMRAATDEHHALIAALSAEFPG